MGRTIFLVTFIANIFLSLVSWAILPSQVAVNFGFNGTPNRWATSGFNTLIFLGIDLLLFCSIYFLPQLTTNLPTRFLNVPNKEYWLRPEHREQFISMFTSLNYEFGSVLFIFLFLVGLLTIQANLSTPVILDEKLFFLFLIIFLVYTIIWSIRFYQAFRI